MSTATVKRLLVRGLPMVLFYLLIAGWRAWPLPAYMASSLPCTSLVVCRYDTIYTTWVLAYETHVLTTAPAHLYQANIYHPAASALLYGPTSLGALPFFAPPFLMTGNPALALNVMYLLCVVFTALGVHLVVRHWTGWEAAGFAAGLGFFANPWTWWAAPMWPQYGVLVYLPWVVLLAAEHLTLARGAVLLVLLVLQSLAEPVYVAPAVFAPLAVLVLYRVLRGRARAALSLLAVLGLAVLVLLPLYVGYARIRGENPSLGRQSLWRDVWMLMFPATLSWNGLAGTGSSDAPWPVLLVPLIGAACMCFAAIPENTYRGWRHAAFWTGVGLGISTRRLVLFDGVGINLNYLARLGGVLPVLGAIREPVRLGIVTAVSVPMLIGLATATLASAAQRAVGPGMQRVSRVVVLAGVAAALYAWCPRPGTFPLQALPTLSPTMLDAIRLGRGPLLEIPVQHPERLDNIVAATFNARAMFRSIFHWRPLVNGYSSYFPAGFPERMAWAALLPEPSAIQMLRNTTGLATILVNLDDLDGSQRTDWDGAVTNGCPGLRLVLAEPHNLLFDVTAP